MTADDGNDRLVFTSAKEWWRYRLTKRLDRASTEAARIQARYALNTFEAMLDGRGPKLLFFGQGKPHLVSRPVDHTKQGEGHEGQTP